MDLTSQNFNETVKQGVVLVDFWAPWCGPCKMLAPILERIAVKLAGSAVVAKLNVDEAPDVAARFGIRSIPTILIFKDGLVKKQLVGVQQEPALAKAVDEVRQG